MFNVDWNDEAAGVIHDVKPFVKDVHICQNQPNINQMILINLETFENEKFCVKLCASGFGVCSRNFNAKDEADVDKWYETPYTMLTEISESYVERFKQALTDKLKETRS